MNQDKYDQRGWCGDENTIQTSKNDPFNRACAGHDSAYLKKMYTRKRADQLFYQRMKVYEWLYEGTPAVKLRRGLFTGIVSCLGWIYWNT